MFSYLVSTSSASNSLPVHVTLLRLNKSTLDLYCEVKMIDDICEIEPEIRYDFLRRKYHAIVFYFPKPEVSHETYCN